MAATMGIALREIGSCPVAVLLRAKTSDVKSTVVPVNPKKENEGVKVVSVPGEDPIRFSALAFREIKPDSDVWEFRVSERHPQTGADVISLWYVLGQDILCVMAQSKVI
jgi:hypothetical protein